ncbi:hypothetical protein WH47_06146 [Habropoda laboriosa]|uniref:Uncharacterized protein n=1 Tax=Habropoda laboriosa TaxID=597456 RepID=A0A0L7RK65_9HYME|nr:hypothetical protein WH47_06146 [Habropoda laboriosa]
MFPIEKAAINNSLAQGASGRQYNQGSIQISNLISETSLQKIAKSAAKQIWSGFITFRSISVGIFGVYVAIKIIQVIVNTILNGIALYTVYGWSIHIITAIWSTLAHFCIFLKQRPNTQRIPAVTQ